MSTLTALMLSSEGEACEYEGELRKAFGARNIRFVHQPKQFEKIWAEDRHHIGLICGIIASKNPEWIQSICKSRPMAPVMVLSGKPTDKTVKDFEKSGVGMVIDVSLHHAQSVMLLARTLLSARNAGSSSHKGMENQLMKLNQEMENKSRELSEANEDLKAFNTAAAHDLRSPAMLIQGYIDLLLMDQEDFSAEHLRFLGHIRKTSIRMLNLVDDLFRFADVQRSVLRHLDMDISFMAEKVIEELKTSIEKPESFTFSVQPNMKMVGDPGLIEVVLRNLIGNAIKYSSKSKNPEILVGMTSGMQAACYVKDNGIGFDQDKASLLFAPFQRLENTGEFTGSGIGMATAYRIIKRHNGEIWAESEKGKGATFFFRI